MGPNFVNRSTPYLAAILCRQISTEQLRRQQAASFEYIEVFYNRKRQHSTLGYKSPIQFMQNWLSEQEQEKLVA